MSTRPVQRSTRPVINHDDNGSMIFALLAIVILTSLITVVLAVTVSQHAKTRKAIDFTFTGQAADAAVNDALLMANRNQASGADALSTYSLGNKRTGGQGAGGFTWSWYSVPTPTTTPTPTYVIVANGCRNSGTAAAPVCVPGSLRTMKATLAGTVVTGLDNRPGKTAYVSDPKYGFSRALLADEDLIMAGASSVENYNSAGPTDPNTGLVQVATNGLATFDSTALPQGGVYLSNTQAQPSSDRCSIVGTGGTTPCDPKIVHNIRPRFEISDTAFIGNVIADPVNGCGAIPLTAWVASEAEFPGRLGFPSSKPLCFSSMNFDEDTSVYGPDGEVYVSGPITVNAGVQVNMSDASPTAKALTIFTSGPVVSIASGTSTNPTQVAWALWAPKASCATDSKSGFVTAYGSMVCKKIFTQGAFTAKWDQALGAGTTPADIGLAVWDIAGYEECPGSPTCSVS